MKTYINLLLCSLSVIFLSCKEKDNKYDASGVFEATEVMVSAQGNGELLQFKVEEGDLMKASAPIGYIDTIQLSLKKKQLQASINATGSRQVNVSRQIASIQEQINTQKREQKRYEQLLKQNAANRKQLDDINSGLATLEKQLAAQTETYNNNNNSLSGEQQALIAQVAQIEDQIQKSIIKSPIDGTVLAKYAEAGELTSTGKALFKVADMKNIHIRAYITAPQLTQLKLNQQVKVYADNGKDDRKEYQGKVTWISDNAEFTPKTIQTRDERANLVYAIKIAVTNDGFIKKGMYGDVKF